MRKSDSEDCLPSMLSTQIVVQFIGELKTHGGWRELRVMVKASVGVGTDVAEGFDVLVQFFGSKAKVV